MERTSESSRLKTLYLILMATFLLRKVSSLPIDLPSDEDPAKTAAQPPIKTVTACGGEVYARFLAAAIEIPNLGPNESIHCEWIIRSPHPSLTIGFVPVETEMFPLYLGFPNNFHLDVHDGEDENDTVLTHWHGPGPNGFEIFRFVVAVVSSGDTLLVKYDAIGPPSLLKAKFLYYLCGGHVESSMFIGSPIFNVTRNDQVPTFLTCTWRIEKPAAARYGIIYVNQLNLPSYCDSLLLSTEGGRLIVQDNCTDSGCFETANSTSQQHASDNSLFHDLRLSEQRYFEELQNNNSEEFQMTDSQTDLVDAGSSSANTSDVTSNSTNTTPVTSPQRHSYEICSKSTKAFMFDGPVAILTYRMYFPETRINFTLNYDIVRDDREWKHPGRVLPWYLNYTQLAIFMPIGLIIGIAIIVKQGRHSRRFKSKALDRGGGEQSARSQTEAGDILLDDVGNELRQNLPRKSIMKVRDDSDPSDDPSETNNNSSGSSSSSSPLKAQDSQNGETSSAEKSPNRSKALIESEALETLAELPPSPMTQERKR